VISSDVGLVSREDALHSPRISAELDRRLPCMVLVSEQTIFARNQRFQYVTKSRLHYLNTSDRSVFNIPLRLDSPSWPVCGVPTAYVARHGCLQEYESACRQATRESDHFQIRIVERVAKDRHMP
jgi:hypothetical protein